MRASGRKAVGLLAAFAAGLALAVGGCADDETEPASTTGPRGENTATLAPEDTTTEQTFTGTTATTDDDDTETESETETDDDDSGQG